MLHSLSSIIYIYYIYEIIHKIIYIVNIINDYVHAYCKNFEKVNKFSRPM